MIARRVLPNETSPSPKERLQTPRSSGPRCLCAAFMRATTSSVESDSTFDSLRMPEMLHIHCFACVTRESFRAVPERVFAHTLPCVLAHLDQLRVRQHRYFTQRIEKYFFVGCAN